MGNAMLRGAKAHEQWVDEDSEDAAAARTVDATLSELLTMVIAGLAGQTPHMVSATVMALGCLLYGFHGMWL